MERLEAYVRQFIEEMEEKEKVCEGEQYWVEWIVVVEENMEEVWNG